MKNRRSQIWAFNQANRDRWVAEKARSVMAGSRVLDVGAGPCRYRRLFEHCDYRAQDFGGLDGQAYGSLDYVSDILNIPVKDESFDVILCTEVLEHVPEPILGLQEFARILKTGGRLFLSAPLGSGLHQRPYHFYGGFTPFWYHHFLHLSGFADIQVEANGGFFKFFGQESRRFCFLLRRNARLFPIWLLCLPWFRFLVPLACHFLDRMDVERNFTVGYHVTATKTGCTAQS